MAEVSAFRGVLYNPDPAVVGSIEQVVTPPYDVINDKAKRRYHERSRYNVIRLILGEEFPGDTALDNKYTRASAFFETWQKTGVLKRDFEPSMYVYEQRYSLSGEHEMTRLSLIALVRIEEFGRGTIFPHEETLSGPKQDRLLLMRACKANFSPIFALYSDPAGSVSEVLSDVACGEPRIDFVDEEGVGHRLWSTADKRLIDEITREMAAKQVFIADGHHRYETAMVFRDEMRAMSGMGPSPMPYDYVMMALVDMETQALTILPTHRVVRGLSGFSVDRFLEGVRPFFTVNTVGMAFNELRSLSEETHAYIAYFGGSRYYLLVQRKDDDVIRDVDSILGQSMSPVRRRLDVTILHGLIFGYVLGMGNDDLQQDDKHIMYTRDVDEAISLVDNGTYQGAFFLNSTRLEEVREVARAGEKMPKKSTYFYPKMITGLVMNKLDSV